MKMVLYVLIRNLANMSLKDAYFIEFPLCVTLHTTTTLTFKTNYAESNAEKNL